MKLLKKFLFFLLFLFALFTTFVLVCAFNSALTRRVADFLYPERTGEGMSAAGEAQEGGSGEEAPWEEPIFGDEAGADGLSGESNPEDVSYPGRDAADILEPGKTDPEESGPARAYVTAGITGRNGYEPIKEEGREIEEEEARQLDEELGYGNTGDDLTFDPLFYPYYAMLDERGQRLYRQIYANANDLYEAFAPVEKVRVGELTDVFAAVIGDHPELFFLNTAYYCKYRRSGICAEIDLSFNRTAQDLPREQTVFWQSADEIINGALALPDDYAREKYVHDTLAERITYDLSAEMSQSAYSALVNGRTVCAGYARAFQYIMQRLGIPCYYCTGYAGESHAWNIVGMEDGYYNVDVTWDDTDGAILYDYFNRSDSDYADTHSRRELSVKLPPCNGERYRGLEQNPEDGKRGIEELGITPQQVLTTLSDYETDCYDRIAQADSDSFIFANVIEGEELLGLWSGEYQSGAYKERFLESAMRAAGADYCELRLSVEELKEDRYLITHQVTLGYP